MVWGDTIHTGVFYHYTDRNSLDDKEPVLEGPPLAWRPLGLSQEQGEKLLKRMM